MRSERTSTEFLRGRRSMYVPPAAPGARVGQLSPHTISPYPHPLRMMTGPLDRPDLILALTPFERPNARVAAAAARAGALGVLDLGRDRARALAALQDTVRWSPGPFGVRVPPGCPLAPGDLPASVDTVILAAGAPWLPAEAGPSRRVLVEVTSPAEAQAVRSDADGGVAKGSGAGGRVGGLDTFLLLPRAPAQPRPRGAA